VIWSLHEIKKELKKNKKAIFHTFLIRYKINKNGSYFNVMTKNQNNFNLVTSYYLLTAFFFQQLKLSFEGKGEMKSDKEI